MSSRSCFGWNTIPRLISPRRMLTVPDIASIRSYYPASIGIQIYISGRAMVLFENRYERIKANMERRQLPVSPTLVLSFQE